MGVYLNGRLVLADYTSSPDAMWGQGYLMAGDIPPYVPAVTRAKVRETLDYIAAHGSAPVR